MKQIRSIALFLVMLCVVPLFAGCASTAMNTGEGENVPIGLSHEYKTWTQLSASECLVAGTAYEMISRAKGQTAVLTFRPSAQIQPLVHFVYFEDDRGAPTVDLHGYADGRWNTVYDTEFHKEQAGATLSKTLRSYGGKPVITAYAECLLSPQELTLQ